MLSGSKIISHAGFSPSKKNAQHFMNQSKFSCQLKSRKKSRLKDDVDILSCRSFLDHVFFSPYFSATRQKFLRIILTKNFPKITLTHFPISRSDREVQFALISVERCSISIGTISVRFTSQWGRSRFVSRWNGMSWVLFFWWRSIRTYESGVCHGPSKFRVKITKIRGKKNTTSI